VKDRKKNTHTHQDHGLPHIVSDAGQPRKQLESHKTDHFMPHTQWVLSWAVLGHSGGLPQMQCSPQRGPSVWKCMNVRASLCGGALGGNEQDEL
jgi:hypothetical protein